ncbi:class A beta-lactamase-related serine hydrolase [Streptomyces sp. NBC_01210]|uniref:serine hydrolase n=1 Tax=Streptomyces sp. NBC_01210 TaxID=2903774 RepID=UPI002E0EA476|nr:class A beta-lactamase-related serine hydrolase [Streptomyces sp. NBC_01210]
MLGTHISRRARRGLATALVVGTTLAALATAAPAEASTAGATVGGAQVTCTSRLPGLAGRLSKDIAGALHGRQGASALALYDRTTATSCTYKADATFDSASVVKATVLGALLRLAMEEHRSLTPHEVDLTTAMITKSDNDATSALWRQIGPKGIQHFLTLAGMRDTVAGPKGYWGRTQITASDELKLLRLLTSDNSVLDRNARTYALGLMNRVVPDQRWGVSAGAPGSATVHLKNGWLPRATKGWRVHSIGAFTGGGHEYAIVVLSHGNRSMNDGIATIEGAARIINRDLTLPKVPTAS